MGYINNLPDMPVNGWDERGLISCKPEDLCSVAL